MSHPVRTFIAAAACALAVGLSACVANPNTAQNPDNKVAKKQKVKCYREAPTGSHIPQMVCYKQQDVEDRRDTDKGRVQNLQVGGAINPNPTSN